MITTHILLLFFWIFYGFLHSFFAAGKIKTAIRGTTSISEDTYRISYNIFAILSLAAMLFFQITTASLSIYEVNNYSKVLSILFAAGGLVIMILCILKYFKQLSGIDGQVKNERLEVKGIHKYVRHPLYLGTFVFLIGLFLWFPLLSNFIAVFVIIVYTLIGIRFEEEKLIGKFGNDYLLYKKHVPMIVPFLKRIPV